jgi:hypothetical protein
MKHACSSDTLLVSSQRECDVKVCGSYKGEQKFIKGLLVGKTEKKIHL